MSELAYTLEELMEDDMQFETIYRQAVREVEESRPTPPPDYDAETVNLEDLREYIEQKRIWRAESITKLQTVLRAFGREMK